MTKCLLTRLFIHLVFFSISFQSLMSLILYFLNDIQIANTNTWYNLKEDELYGFMYYTSYIYDLRKAGYIELLFVTHGALACTSSHI